MRGIPFAKRYLSPIGAATGTPPRGKAKGASPPGKAKGMPSPGKPKAAPAVITEKAAKESWEGEGGNVLETPKKRGGAKS